MTHPGPLAQLPSPEDETDPTAESDPAEELAPEQLRPRRWPLLVLLVGALGLVALFEGVAPKERAVTLRFSDPKTVRAVELVWRDHDGDHNRRNDDWYNYWWNNYHQWDYDDWRDNHYHWWHRYHGRSHKSH